MTAKWVGSVQARARNFAKAHGTTYNLTDRQLSASFEIGCFHALVDFYARAGTIVAQNTVAGEYRYLTTPAGNPNNFSYVECRTPGESFQIRQQVRVRSHVHNDICFTPDLVVFPSWVSVLDRLDPDYASGKRRFLSISSDQVVAAHECKSMNPFPELVVGFIGMLMVGHAWAGPGEASPLDDNGLHLAPTLFVGGAAQGLNRRMIAAVKSAYPVNVVVGMHAGTWDLFGDLAQIKRMVTPASFSRQEISDVLATEVGP